MDRINTTIDVSPDEVVSGIGDLVPIDPARQFTYLTMILQSFTEKMKEYYRAASTTADRTHRLNNIRRTLLTVSFTADSKNFTIKPSIVMGGGPGRMSCPPEEKLVDDFCMVTASPVP